MRTMARPTTVAQRRNHVANIPKGTAVTLSRLTNGALEGVPVGRIVAAAVEHFDRLPRKQQMSLILRQD